MALLTIRLVSLQGAPERIIGLCTTILVGNREYPLDDEWIDAFNKVYHTIGAYGERVLGTLH